MSKNNSPKTVIDKIVRTKRKTVSLCVSDDATLIVRAPLRTPVWFINDFVEDKMSWINKRKAQALKRKESIREKRFTDGEEFLYLGDPYKFKISPQDEIGLDGELCFPEKFLPKAKEHMIDWYKKEALQVITDRVRIYGEITGWKEKSVRISNARTRWGSCGASGSLNFSWRLIMAPIEIVDYLVVHELSHLKVRNHSARYWNTVRSVMPDYKEHEKWLKINGSSLWCI